MHKCALRSRYGLEIGRASHLPLCSRIFLPVFPPGERRCISSIKLSSASRHFVMVNEMKSAGSTVARPKGQTDILYIDTYQNDQLKRRAEHCRDTWQTMGEMGRLISKQVLLECKKKISLLLSIGLPIYLSICPSIPHSIISSIPPCIRSSIPRCFSFSPSVYMSVCQSVRLSDCLSAYK